MKKNIVIIAMALTCGSVIADPVKDAAKIRQLYSSGVNALNQGNYEKARESFKGILKINPRHGQARHQLANLKTNHARIALKQRKARFNLIILEKIDLNNASIQEAFDVLNVLTLEASQKKFTPNFVINDPNKVLEGRTITLRLDNVPLSVAMKYILETAKADARYDKFATVISPRRGVKKLPPPALKN